MTDKLTDARLSDAALEAIAAGDYTWLAQNKAVKMARELLAHRAAEAQRSTWQSVGVAGPIPHARYLVWRDNCQFTATPCYGLHAPWWVVKTMDGESTPVAMADTDIYCPLPAPPDGGRDQ